MNKINIILLLVLVAVVAIGLTVVVYASSLVKYEEVYTDVIVVSAKVGGFAIDNTGIRFGKLAPGNRAERDFHLFADRRVFVKVGMKGNVSDFLSVSENNFVLEPGEYKRIKLAANVPLGTALGNYSGYVQVYYYKPWFR